MGENLLQITFVHRSVRYADVMSDFIIKSAPHES